MPNIQNFTTEELLEALGQYVAPAGDDLFEELVSRVIKENDDDDSEQHRGGIRPRHAPIVP